MNLTARVLFAGCFLLGSVAYAGTLTLETSAGALGANDHVTWGALGPDSTLIPNVFAATSVGSLAIGGSFSSSTGDLVVVGTSWTPPSGAFTSGDSVIWANDGNNGTGPITLTFPTLLGAGAAIQYDVAGQFTAQLSLYSGSTLIGSVTRTSDSAGDAIFIGALDSLSEVTKAVFSVTAAPSGDPFLNPLGDFAIDTLYLNNPPSAPPPSGTPEPGSMFLLGGGLAALSLTVRRRSGRS